MRDGLKKAIRTGRLSRLIEAINNPNELVADANAFQQALTVYTRTVMEEQRLEYDKTHREYFAREKGAQAASTVAGVMTCVASLPIVIIWLVG